MTRDDIIRMAREAGFICLLPDEAAEPKYAGVYMYDSNVILEMERLAKAAYEAGAAAEREACAKVCDDHHDRWRFGDETDSVSGPKECAQAIRTRGVK